MAFALYFRVILKITPTVTLHKILKIRNSIEINLENKNTIKKRNPTRF